MLFLGLWDEQTSDPAEHGAERTDRDRVRLHHLPEPLGLLLHLSSPLSHLIGHLSGPLLILVSMDVPVVIMVEAGLSFLGLGVRPPTPSWGSILYDAYANMRSAPGMVVLAGLPLVLATLGFTFLGEGLRDALDPKLRIGRAP